MGYFGVSLVLFILYNKTYAVIWSIHSGCVRLSLLSLVFEKFIPRYSCMSPQSAFSIFEFFKSDTALSDDFEIGISKDP